MNLLRSLKNPSTIDQRPTEKDPANMAKEKGQVKKGEPDYRNLASRLHS